MQGIEDGLGLCVADVRVIALAVAGVGVALGYRALGLEMVGHGNEGLLALLQRLEFLGERFAGGAGEAIILEDAGFADGLDHILVVDERGTDDIRGVRYGVLGRRGDEGPLIGACGLVELFRQVLEGLIALGEVTGDGVAIFDFGKADDVGIEAVDGGDNLALLVFQRGLGIGPAGLAAVDGDLIALAVGVGAAAEFLAQGGEVVQHVEGADGVLALDVIDGVELGRAGILPRDGQVCALGVAGDRGGGLEAPLLMREAHDDGVLESHGIGGAQGLDGLGIILGDVRQRGILVGLEIVAGAAVIQGDQLIGVVLG